MVQSYKYSNRVLTDNRATKFNEFSDEELSGEGFHVAVRVGQEELVHDVWMNHKNHYVVILTIDSGSWEAVEIVGLVNYLDFVREYLNPLVSCYSQQK